MKLTPQQVLHVAKLAKLKLSEEEVRLFADQLSRVLDYMKILNEADTEDVKPMFQSTGLQNEMREDLVKRDLASADEVIECTNRDVENRQIVVPRVI